MKKLFWFMSFVGYSLLATGYCNATPSTQVWNPSTDIQAVKTFHLTDDIYVNDVTSQYYFGVEYGPIKNLEVGFDINENQFSGVNAANSNPLYFNAKYGLPESKAIPAVAVGVMNVGTKADVTNYNMFFALAAKTFNPIGRLSVGGYSGNDKLFLDEAGQKANTGAVLSLDKNLTDKIWAAIDYASGSSSYGYLSFGASYAFSSNTSVIFGYLIPNNYKINTSGNVFTTQLDINF